MHFLTVVILPNPTNNILGDVTRLLLGSEADSQKFFPNYAKRCYCFGSIARNKSFAQFDSSQEGVKLLNLLHEARQKQDSSTENKLLNQRAKSVLEIEKTHPQYMQIDKDCDICSGTGFWQDSRDPRLHWDYWSVGGNWSGLLPDFSVIGVEFDDELDRNIAKASLLPDDLFIEAIVTPEGYWYEPSTYYTELSPAELAYDFELEDRKNWKKEILKFKKNFLNHYAVIIDCHC